MNWPEDIPMPEAVREYEEQRLPVKEGCVTLCWQDYADAAIEELAEALHEAETRLYFRGIAWEKSKARAEQAEAEVARLRELVDGWLNTDEGTQTIARLQSEVARLEKLLDAAWTERRKRSVERRYNSGMRTKRQWLRTLADSDEPEQGKPPEHA